LKPRDGDIRPRRNGDGTNLPCRKNARKADISVSRNSDGANLARPRRKCREAFTPRIVAPAYARSIPPLEGNDGIGHFRLLLRRCG
jgi:hypothetical protein